MQIVRNMLRVVVLVLSGLAVFYGLVLLFHAQVALNRYAELHASQSETSLTTGLTGDESAKSQSSFIESPALASAANDALHPSTPASNVQTTSPELPANGERAFPVRVSSARIVAGAAAADRQVDVVLAHQTESGSTFSEVVLENVRVLTIEPIAAGDSNNERSDIYAVRLDVDAESADNLLLASQAGTLSLVLHGAKDDPDDRPSESRRDSIPALAQEEPKPAHDEATPAQDDDPRFTQVRINRVGGPTSTYRVPRER